MLSRLLLILSFVLFLFSNCHLYGQSSVIADRYHKEGEYEKAYVYYGKIYEKSPQTRILIQMVDCKQQLEDYKIARELLQNHMKQSKIPELHVLLGYNFQLQLKSNKAEEEYQKAVVAIDQNPAYAYNVARQFENRSLLKYALKTYKKGMTLNPSLNMNYLIGKIYGQMGDYQQMFDYYMKYIQTNTQSKYDILNVIRGFISTNAENINNQRFRKVILKYTQTDPNPLWNEMLSWLYIHQKDFDKAFIQQKAIYTKSNMVVTLNNIFEIADNATDNEQFEIAITILDYLIETAPVYLQIKASLQKINIRRQLKKEKLIVIDNRYQELITQFGESPETIPIRKSYAEFLAYDNGQYTKAEALIKTTISISNSKQITTDLKMSLGDIMVFSGRYNRALIYYTQIQNEMKNSAIGQQALFKIAQTSFFRGDFSWAESQLQILKSATSQRIANDALHLKWVITDNYTTKDSTQFALKRYARASLLSLQKKTDDAIATLDTLITVHKGQPIEDDALLLRASLNVQQKNYKGAVVDYQQIIDFYGTDVYADEAIYHLAKLYDEKLKEPKKAQSLYEQVIINHSNSVYYVSSRKRYRKLRGDQIKDL